MHARGTAGVASILAPVKLQQMQNTQALPRRHLRQALEKRAAYSALPRQKLAEEIRRQACRACPAPSRRARDRGHKQLGHDAPQSLIHSRVVPASRMPHARQGSLRACCHGSSHGFSPSTFAGALWAHEAPKMAGRTKRKPPPDSGSNQALKDLRLWREVTRSKSAWTAKESPAE